MQEEEGDFRFRMLVFRGACGEPPRRRAPLRVSPIPLISQESRTLSSNQHSVLKKMFKRNYLLKLVKKKLHLKTSSLDATPDYLWK
jgi:hypothetical protein